MKRGYTSPSKSYASEFQDNRGLKQGEMRGTRGKKNEGGLMGTSLALTRDTLIINLDKLGA